VQLDLGMGLDTHIGRLQRAPYGFAVGLGVLSGVAQLALWTIVLSRNDLSATLGVSGGLAEAIPIIRLALGGLAGFAFAKWYRTITRCRLNAVGGIVGSAAMVLASTATNQWTLLVFCVLGGVSAGMGPSIFYPELLRAYPGPPRVRALALYRGMNTLGIAGAFALVGLFRVALDLTWRSIFLAAGVAGVTGCLLLVRITDPRPGETRSVLPPAQGQSGEEQSRGSIQGLRFEEQLRRLWALQGVRLLLTAFALVGAMSVPLVVYVTSFLTQEWSLKPGPILGIFGVGFALSVVVVIAAPTPLAAAIGHGYSHTMRVVALVFALGGLGVVVVALSPFLALAIVGCVAALILFTFALFALDTLLSLVVPPDMRAAAGALKGLAVSLVGVLGGFAVLTGLQGQFGPGGALVVLAIVTIGFAGSLTRSADDLDHDARSVVDDLVASECISIKRRSGARAPMLECLGLDFSYGQLQVLFGVDFRVDDGELVALLGTNGAGKSTLLRVLSGLGSPTRGTVHFDGVNITHWAAERRVHLGITQISGGKAVFGPLSVVENIQLFGYTSGHKTKAIQEGIEAAFSIFPALAERRHQMAQTLSGGQQQMLALTKALILRPRLLLIDEFSLGLAPVVVGELIPMVREINRRGASVVVVEQSVNVALSLAEHAYFMEKGEIRFDGDAKQLLSRRDLLRSVFLEGAVKQSRGEG
jgi:ABC-type branched-subunit amino acid transport system ATPase component/MFS family permease